MAPYLFWKKYITRIQMIQFVFVMGHALQLLFRDCDFPKIFVSYIGFYAVLFMVMFSNFYVKAYRRKTNAKKEEEKERNNQVVHVNDSLSDDMCKKLM